MRARPRLAPLLLTLFALSPSPSAAAQSAPGEQAAVRAIADSALAAVSRNDFVAFTDLMLDSAVTYSAGERAGQAWTSFRTRAQERALQSNQRFTERGFNPTAMVSGPVAMVWMPYDFYVDGSWSHCGVDIFTLLKGPEGWRIATVAWSIEQPPACAKHPKGPPGN